MSCLLGGFDDGASTLMFEKDISNQCKPEIKGRGFVGSGNEIIETQTYYTQPELDWVFDENQKLTYNNPVFTDQCKKQGRDWDALNTGWVDQHPLDENPESKDDDDDDDEDDDNDDPFNRKPRMGMKREKPSFDDPFGDDPFADDPFKDKSSSVISLKSKNKPEGSMSESDLEKKKKSLEDLLSKAEEAEDSDDENDEDFDDEEDFDEEDSEEGNAEATEDVKPSGVEVSMEDLNALFGDSSSSSSEVKDTELMSIAEVPSISETTEEVKIPTDSNKARVLAALDKVEGKPNKIKLNLDRTSMNNVVDSSKKSSLKLNLKKT